MIDVEGLSYRFEGSAEPVLRDVNLHIDAGEFVVVTGASGSGKTTLALALGGYLFRQFEGEAKGQVTVAGIDVRERPIYDVAEVVGLVQQNPEAQFVTLTVGDEVAFGLENRCLPRHEIRERVAWALDTVGAGHLAGRTLATLSGGEKQKVAVAAVMAARPQVLIFDEPTSNLDPTATADIFSVIARIREEAGLTVIVIEHKVDYLLPFGPRLIRLERGQVAYDGPVTERTAAPGGCERDVAAEVGRAPLVRTWHLHAGYGGEAARGGFALREVTLDVYPGELVAVMGDNGSGKSTFLHCVLGLLKPTNGYVEVMGLDTRHTPVSRVAREVGFVFQNPDHQLFADSVWHEAMFAPENLGRLNGKTAERVERLLVRSGLDGRLEDHPYRLSYGQKRRLNLVSVLSYRPRLILLDEMLIGQDPANAAFLLEVLGEEVARGGSVILVNHAPEVTRRCASRVLFFDAGRCVVDAPSGEAFARLRDLGKEAYVPRG
ncbi:MAG: ABC transporter ATP-binding protein [Anaerolineae bacterium]|nr:ABC transporter ATP-binding protein [Anaerolineae bacterium]